MLATRYKVFQFNLVQNLNTSFRKFANCDKNIDMCVIVIVLCVHPLVFPQVLRKTLFCQHAFAIFKFFFSYSAGVWDPIDDFSVGLEEDYTH